MPFRRARHKDARVTEAGLALGKLVRSFRQLARPRMNEREFAYRWGMKPWVARDLEHGILAFRFTRERIDALARALWIDDDSDKVAMLYDAVAALGLLAESDEVIRLRMDHDLPERDLRRRMSLRVRMRISRAPESVETRRLAKLLPTSTVATAEVKQWVFDNLPDDDFFRWPDMSTCPNRSAFVTLLNIDDDPALRGRFLQRLLTGAHTGLGKPRVVDRVEVQESDEPDPALDPLRILAGT